MLFITTYLNSIFLENSSSLQKLYIENNIEIPVKKINNKLCIRLSINIYNKQDDINKLLNVTEYIIKNYLP